jgi:hypothetical protein
MKVKVLSWNAPCDYHYVRNIDDFKDVFRVDLMVSGDLGEIDPASLVGKVVEYERDHPYIRIAHGVTILDEVQA